MEREFDFQKWLNMYRMTLQQLKKDLGFAVFVVDKEIVLIARKNAEVLYERYQKEVESDWKGDEKKADLTGMIGEQIFKAALYQLEIEHLYTEPIYPHGLRRPYDFKCSEKTIEVKTIPYGEKNKRLIIKVQDWSKSDLVVPIKIVDEVITEAHIIGFLTKSEVEELPVAERGQFPCFYGRCFHCLLEDVTKKHTAYELFKILKPTTPLN